MKSLMITCKEATEFVSKKEEKKLSILEEIQFFIHLAICKFCALFYKQNKILQSHFLHISHEKDLTKEDQEKIVIFLESNIPQK